MSFDKKIFLFLLKIVSAIVFSFIVMALIILLFRFLYKIFFGGLS